MAEIQHGDAIRIREVDGEWLPAVAHTGIEPTHRDGRKIHDFPVYWVRVAGRADPLPWPAEDVRPWNDKEADRG